VTLPANAAPIEVWVTASVAAKLLGTYPTKIAKFASNGLVARRHLPGCYPTYRLADIEALARSSTTETSGPTQPEDSAKQRSKAAELAKRRLDAIGI
jgi:hypothetical protein